MTHATLTRHALAALGFCAALTVATPAGAAVRYEFQSLVVTTSLPSVAAVAATGYTFLPLTFTVSDEAVTRGSFKIRGSGNPLGAVNGIAGDVADFISLTYRTGTAFTPLSIGGLLDLRIAFAPDQSVTDFYLDFGNYSDDFTLRSITGNLVGTTRLAADSIQPCSAELCSIVGRIEVPEPASLALLGVGLLGLAAARRRLT